MLKSVVIAAMVAGLALSASPVFAQTAPVAELPTATPPEMVARYKGAEWTYPGGKEMADVYPMQAMNAEIGGEARIACRIAADGRMSECGVIEENPAGMGFGPATAGAFQTYARVAPKSVEGGIQDGDFKIFAYHWVLD